MTAGYLLHRILLEFNDKGFHQDLSTVAFADGYLWLGSDELNSIERLSQVNTWTFGQHKSFELAALLNGFNNDDGEVDIEGLAYANHYLWLIGSHSTKRKKVKDNNVDRLKTVKVERNRYLLARIPLLDGNLVQSSGDRKATYLEKNEDGNLLMSALKQDEHLMPFLTDLSSEQKALPGKDNGFDIEGLVADQNKLLIGLRGPVLRGIAILLSIELIESETGFLQLKPDKNGKLYQKHFLDLDGLGIRELCFDGNDLLILAGPTMDLDGTLKLFRLKHPFELSDNSFSQQNNGLNPIFTIPHGDGTDKAEGAVVFPSLDRSDCLLVVYDSPDPHRIVKASNVLADIFVLK